MVMFFVFFTMFSEASCACVQGDVYDASKGKRLPLVEHQVVVKYKSPVC